MHTAKELKERWEEDKNDRRLSLQLIKDHLTELTPQQMNDMFAKNMVDDVENLRWFVERLIAKNIELEESLEVAHNRIDKY